MNRKKLKLERVTIIDKSSGKGVDATLLVSGDEVLSKHVEKIERRDWEDDIHA